MKIIQDPMSKSFLFLAVLITLYFIFVKNLLEPMIYPIILLVGALVFRVFFNRKVEIDETIDPVERRHIFIHFLIGLIGIGIGNLLVRGLYDFPISVTLTLLAVDALLFTALMAIVEEQFFRGELLEWMSNTMTPFLAILANAALFTAYHLGVYGKSPDTLLFVLVGGISLAVITVKSLRLMPAVGAHFVNNLMSEVSKDVPMPTIPILGGVGEGWIPWVAVLAGAAALIALILKARSSDKAWHREVRWPNPWRPLIC